MKLFAEITKRDDDARIVTGYASSEALDCQGEIIKREAMQAALPDYMKFANIREMHSTSAAGIALKADYDDKGLLLEAHIVDDAAWKKVKAGVYKGFSIGGRVTSRDPANAHIITGLDLSEISLVDRPANPEALIEMFKAHDGDTTDLVANAPVEKKAEEPEAPGSDDMAAMAGAHRALAAKHAETAAVQRAKGNEPAARAAEAHADAHSNAAFGLDRAATSLHSVGKAETEGDLAKAGRRNSQSDQDKLQSIHDQACDLGAGCDAAKADATGDLAKARSEAGDLRKAVDTLTAERDGLTKSLSEVTVEFEALKAKPAPDKAVLKVVAKADDVDAAAKADTITKSEPEPPRWFVSR